MNGHYVIIMVTKLETVTSDGLLFQWMVRVTQVLHITRVIRLFGIHLNYLLDWWFCEEKDWWLNVDCNIIDTIINWKMYIQDEKAQLFYIKTWEAEKISNLKKVYKHRGLWTKLNLSSNYTKYLILQLISKEYLNCKILMIY